MELLTPQDKEQLEQRLNQLKADRPVLSKRIGEARAQGDLSENAEYHAVRETQGLAEAEIRRIEQRLKNASVMDDASVPDDMVFLGSVVRLKDLSDDTDDVYKVVGESSGNFDADEIEVTTASPMGEVLMKTRVGEVVKVDLPRGTKRFEVLEIL